MTAPSNLFLCARNLADEAIITSTVSPVSTLPLSNLQRSSRARVWRNGSAAAVDIIFNLSGTTSERVNFVHFHRHNLETNGYWRVRLYPTYDASGAASYDSGLILALDGSTLSALDWGVDPLGGGVFNGFPRFSTAYFMENTATVINSVRITVDDTGNSAGYTEASRAYFGRGVELDYNWENLHLKYNETTKQSRSDGDSLFSDGTAAFRELQMDTKWISMADRAELADMLRYAGMRKDWFVSGKPGIGGEDERDYAGLFRVSSMPSISTLMYQLYSSQLKFTEI